jgi:hypothetical protein
MAGRPSTRFTNPWKETLGCEVNVCQATWCDEHRMKICALRKYYLDQVRMLREHMEKARSETTKEFFRARLRALDAIKEDE